MAFTDVAAVAGQIQKFWSPIFTPELREAHPLINLLDKKYSGEIKKGGDQVTVSQIVRVPAERKTIGVAGYNTFDSNTLVTRKVDIKADQIITAAVEIDDLVELQSQIGDQDSEIRLALMHGCMENLNNYLYSLVAPSTSAPDHAIVSANVQSAELINIRKLMSEAHIPMGQRYGLMSPEYWATLISDATLRSQDYAPDGVTVAGQMALQRFGINLFEDDSRTGKYGLFFHPDFMHLVMQQEPTFKLSDLHSNKQHGYLLSVSLVCGAKIGIEGAVKHIVYTPS